MWEALNRLRRLSNSSLFCRDVRSTVCYSAETFVHRLHVRLTCVDAFFDVCGALLMDLLRRLPRGPSSSSTAISSRTFFDACLEVLARRLRRPPQGRSLTHASRSFLVVYDAFFKELPRCLRPPPSRSFLLVCGALFKDLPRRLRLPRGPRSSSAAPFSGTFFDAFLEVFSR